MANLLVKRIFTSAVAVSTVVAGFAAPLAARAASAGEVYKTTDGTVWFITNDNTRRPFSSFGAFQSYGFLSQGQIKDADASVTALPAGALIAPQDGRIFCASATKGTDVAGECSLITGSKKAAFTSSAVFTGQGYSFARAFYGDSSFLEKTTNIDNASAQHRAGTLINNGGTVQLVVTGGLWGVPSLDVFNAWGWSFADVVPANSADTLLTQTGIIPARTAGQLVPTATTTPGGNTGDCNLDGSTGSITLDDLSDYSNEEVGEGEDEVPVMAFEVEADNDSDVAITSVKVELDENGAGSEDLDDYANEVTIWLGDEMVGSADVEDFDETSTDGTWTKTISLDCAEVSADDTADFVVAVSANNVIDSNDLNQAWIADVISVRFEDGDGVTTTEDTDADGLEKTFTFQSFATAADVELEVSTNTDDDEEINNAHVIDIDDSADTDNVEVLSFTLEATGDSDINVTEIPVVLTSAELADGGYDEPGDIITTARLIMNGDEIANSSVAQTGAADTETITFDDLDIDIDAGDTVDLIVALDIQDTGTALDNGDTISADITATETDLIDATDEEGDDVSTTDLVGTATGGTHGLFDRGIIVELVDTSVTKSNGEQAVNSDSGLFEITFDVTAFDSDAYVDHSAPLAAGGSGESDLTITGAGTVTATIDSPEAVDGTDGFFVEEGTTERFTVTVDIRDGATDMVDGFFDVAMGSIAYALTDVDATLYYNFDLADYKTSQIFLDDRE